MVRMAHSIFYLMLMIERRNGLGRRILIAIFRTRGMIITPHLWGTELGLWTVRLFLFLVAVQGFEPPDTADMSRML